MTPREIMSRHTPNRGDYRTGETTEELWKRKADEAEDVGLISHMQDHGVRVPISIDPDFGAIRGGHHRIAGMHRINPDQFIPVTYEHDIGGAWDAEAEVLSRPENADIKDIDWD